MNAEGVRKRLASPWAYFGLALGWSWLFWVPLALWGRDVSDPRVMALFILGGGGPPLAAMLLVYLTQGRGGWRDFWVRVVDFRRIGLRWYFVILLIVPVWTALGVVAGYLAGHGLPDLQPALARLGDPLTLLSLGVFLLLFGPVPEELGWRGYALDRLQEGQSALAASFVLGVFWFAWHIPQFFIPGLPIQEAFPLGSLAFWLAFAVSLPAQSVLYTWVFNNTRRSTLSAVLLHFMTNFTGEVLGFEEVWRLYAAGGIIVLAVVVVVFWGPRTMTRSRGPATMN